MKKFARLIAGAASLAAAATLVAGTAVTASAAPNDPPKGATVHAYDIVGVGSNTTEYVIDQLFLNYDKGIKTDSPATPMAYSWDALPPGQNTPNPKYMITPKAGCTKIARPNGSSAGLTALDSTQVIKSGGVSYPCIDFSRSSGGRKPTNPGKKPGGIEFVAFARDAITWAVRSKAAGGSLAPATLDLAQLKKIFTCKVTNWKQVGGGNGAIKVFLPQTGSGTLSTWEKFMGITGSLGSCVSQKPEENEGTYSGFNNKNAIFIYSVGAYVAQKYHEANCGAKPKAGQNLFGCNQTGVLAVQDINGVIPIANKAINKNFPSSFWRTIYNIVPFVTGTKDNMSLKLEKLFGAKAEGGYICSNAGAQTVIKDYGFVPYALCGSTS